MKKSLSLALLSLAALAAPALALPGPASATFAKGAQFEVAGYDASKPALAGFPVLVRIAENSPLGFSYDDLISKATGADIAFVDMNGNGLPFEIDTWDPDGTSLVWVTLPSMAHGTQFVMCWGSAASGKTVCAENPFAGYKGVWHMNAASPADASGNGNDGTAAGNADVAAGRIGSALSLPNKSDYVTCGKNQSNAELKDAFTVEAWANLANLSGNHCIFGKNLFISFRTSGNSQIQVTTPGKKDHNMNATVPAAGTWWHVVLTFQKNTGNGCKVYVNGALAVQTGSGDIQDQSDSTEMWLGRNQWGNDQNFQGLLDEMRLSAGIQSADWIAATYATQSDAAFLTAGEATPYAATAEPQVGVVATDVQYTNATLSVSIGSLGMNAGMTADAAWLDAVVLVATDNTFATPVLSLPLARLASAPAAVTAAAVPLATNTTYYAKVLATNEFAVVGESSVAHFTTHAPGVPTGTALFRERGFSTLSATATAAAFGTGAERATMRLEASADGFATVVPSTEIAATPGETATFTVANLTPGTDYALRVRIRNDWGLDTFVPLPGTATRSVPFATTGIGWTFSPDGSTIDIAFGITGVYDGAMGEARLTYNGQSVAPVQPVSATGTLTWPAIPAAKAAATATVVLSATLDGQSYSQTFSATIAPGSTAVGVSDFAEHQSSETSVRVRVGDVVTLPELAGADFYYLGNNRFGSLVGNVLTATEPGILGVFRVTDAGATTNTLPVIVLPEKIGNGDIYILKDGSIGNSAAYWDDTAKWEKVGSETNDSWPHNSDDIAILGYWRNTGSIQFEPHSSTDITLGALYFGNFRNAESKAGFRNMGKLIFSRTDGKPGLVQFCANDRLSVKSAILLLQDSISSVEFPCGVVLDGGWDGVADNCPQATFEFKAPSFLLPEGKTLLLQNFSPSRSGEGTSFEKPFKGGGVIWNRSAANFNWTGESLSGFTGTLRDSGHGAASFGYQAPLFVRSSGSNTVAEVVGFVSANTDANPHTSASSVGILQTGFNQGWRDAGIHQNPWFTGRGLLLHGGTYVANFVEKVWGYGAADKKIGDVLTLSGGLNFLNRSWSRDQLSGYPINWVEFKSVAHGDKSSLVLWGDFWTNGDVSTADKTITIAGTTTTETIPAGSVRTNHVTILSGISTHAVGPNGDPRTTALHPVVPWILAPVNNSGSGWNALAFAAFDENGRLVTPVRAEVTSLTADAVVPGADVLINDRTIEISADVTVNSLLVNNSNKGKTLGEGRTLTVSSGGLILHGAGAIGTEAGGAANGSLVLGDATHPAYVWARGKTSGPNQLWAPVTAPGGFVSAYTGNLVLGGNQTNILDELIVNAGSLTLGSATTPCRLAKNLPIRIYANATLKLPNADSTGGKLLYFDGAAGWFGKVEVADGVEAACKKAFWRDYPESPEWKTFPRGYYSGDEATANSVDKCVWDPVHFSGSGVIRIVQDECIDATLMILR